MIRTNPCLFRSAHELRGQRRLRSLLFPDMPHRARLGGAGQLHYSARPSALREKEQNKWARLIKERGIEASDTTTRRLGALFPSARLIVHRYAMLGILGEEGFP